MSFIRNIFKYSILIFIKETYLLIRNSLGLYYHPYKTIKLILHDRDFSQFFLFILGLPLYVIILGLFIIWVGRRLVQAPPGEWGSITYLGVIVVSFVGISLWLYLGFFLSKNIKVKIH